MASTAIARYFGFSLLFLGAAMIAPGLAGLSYSDAAAGNYFFGAAVTLFCSSALLLLAGGGSQTVGFRSTLLLIFLWWAATPIFGALPLWLEGWSIIDGYFEIVSAMTTTGASLDTRGIVEGRVDLIWKAVLQWIGGLASLAIAAAIFIRPAFVGADTAPPSFSRGERDSYVHAIALAIRSFAGIYLLITVALALALSAAGLSAAESAIISMSAVASGGIIPHGDGLAGFAPMVSVIVAPFILISGMNFILIDRAAHAKSIDWRDAETFTFLALVAVIGLAMWGFAGARDLPASLFNAASLFSTNGITIGTPPGLVLALVTVIIGGSAVSTAGGLKILRWIVIMRRTRLEVRRLVMPYAVFGPKSASNELGVWMHFLVFTVVLGLLTAGLTAGGHPFEVSAAGAVGALANAGPVLGLTESGEEGYQVFDDAADRLFWAAGMILGRLEGVAALMLINRTFWRG